MCMIESASMHLRVLYVSVVVLRQAQDDSHACLPVGRETRLHVGTHRLLKPPEKNDFIFLMDQNGYPMARL
jgi:hypothetical protein